MGLILNYFYLEHYFFFPVKLENLHINIMGAVQSEPTQSEHTQLASEELPNHIRGPAPSSDDVTTGSEEKLPGKCLGAMSGANPLAQYNLSPEVLKQKLFALADVKQEVEAVMGPSAFSVALPSPDETLTISSSATDSGVTGGAGVIGGLDDLQNYANTSYSKAKERLIRAIAKDVFRALGMKNAAKADSAPIKVIVEGLAKVVPNPRKGAKFVDDFNSSSKSQRKVCQVLAAAINKHYSGVVVNTEASEALQCRQISEIMHTLLMGLHTEFMTVAGDVMRIVRNIRTLQEVVDASYKRQTEIVRSSGDPRLKEQSNDVKHLYDRISEELNRQMAMLSNMINITVGPTGRSLIELLEENRDFSGLIRDLSSELGTDAFSTKLGYLLTGVSNVAQAANKIQKALDTLGMSLPEFKNVGNLSELRAKVFGMIQKRQPNSKELEKLLNAAEIIYRNNYSHRDIVAELSKRGRGPEDDDDDRDGGIEEDDALDENNAGSYLNRPTYDLSDDEDDPQRGRHGGHRCELCGAEPCECASHDHDRDSDNDDDSVRGGGRRKKTLNADGRAGGFSEKDSNELDPSVAGLPYEYAKRSLTARTAKKEKHRKLLMKDFKMILRRAFKKVSSSGRFIASAIGEEIPVSEDLSRFINAFKQLPNIDRHKIESALSGYARDPVSRQAREEFLNSYELVIRTLEPLIRGPGGEHFVELRDALRDMMRSVDQFSTKVVDAITEIHIDRPEEIREQLRGISDFVMGGAEGGEYTDIKKTQNDMAYAYSIANIKGNLKISSAELKSFAKDYKGLLGSEAGWLRDQITAEYNGLLSAVDSGLSTSTSQVAQSDLATLENELKTHVRDGQLVADDITTDYTTIVTVETGRVANNPAHANSIAADNAQKIGKCFASDDIGDARARLVRILNRQYLAKKNLVDAAESIDLHMKNFTDAIAKDPNGLKNVEKFLASIELVTNLFTERGGDHLAALFEVFPKTYDPAGVVGGQAKADWSPVIDSNWDKDEPIINLISPDKHYYEVIDEKKGAAGNSLFGLPIEHKNVACLEEQTSSVLNKMTAIDNILQVFINLSSQYNMHDDKIISYPVLRKYIHDYIAMSAYTSTFVAWAVNNVGNDNEQANRVNINTRLVDNKSYNIITSEKTTGLANAPSMWVKDNASVNPDWTNIDIGNTYGIRTGTIFTKSHNLTQRLRLTSVAMSSIPKYDQKNKPKYDVAGAATSRPSPEDMHGAAPTDFWNYHNPADRGVHADVAGWLDNMYDTDLLFIMMIKAIVAKIFTAIDAYRLFHRPSIDRQYYDSSASVRAIIGGAEHMDRVEQYVPVESEAVSLYLRLPLLAEWYRSKYGLEGNEQNPWSEQKLEIDKSESDAYRLTLVPNVLDVWGEFMKLMFDSFYYVDNGYYSDHQIQQIITTINRVYKKYKAAKYSVMDIINAFVVEVNRAYGFLKTSDINKYLEGRFSYLKESKYPDEEDIDYELLGPADDFGRGPLPSDAYTRVSPQTRAHVAKKMVHLQKIIVRMREGIDNEFRRYTQALAPGEYSNGLNALITSCKSRIDQSHSPRDKYQAVLSMIQGVNRQLHLPVEHLIMLHETVAAPLYVLTAVFKCMAKFNGTLLGLSDVAIKKVNNANDETKLSINSTDYKTIIDSIVRNFKDLITNVNLQSGAEVLLRAAATQLFGSKLESTVHGYAQDSIHGIYITNLDVTNHANDYYKVSQHLRLRNLLSAILDLGSNPNKLVECSTTGATVSVRYTDLEDTCVKLLAKVKSNLIKLTPLFVYSANVNPHRTPLGQRPNISTDHTNVLSNFTNYKFVGSIPWLEQNLIEQLFQSKSGVGLQRSLAHFNATLPILFNRDDVKNDNVLRELCYYPASRSQVFDTRCVFPDLSVFPFSMAPFHAASQTTTLPPNETSSLFKLNKIDHLTELKASDATTINTIFSIPTLAFFRFDETWNSDPGRHSLIFAFNIAYRELLRTCLGSGTLIDARIIKPLAEGPASTEVFSKRTFTDVCTIASHQNLQHQHVAAPSFITGAANTVQWLTSPHRDGILSASNAIITHRLLTESQATALPGTMAQRRFLITDQQFGSDEYKSLLEKWRVILPYFATIFTVISNRCTILRDIITGTELKNTIQSTIQNIQENSYNGHSTANYPLFDERTANKSSAEREQYFTQFLTKMSRMCVALISGISEVQRSIVDTKPKFMDFRSYDMSGGSALVPASDVIVPMLSYSVPINRQPVPLLLPTTMALGELSKYNEGARIILARPSVEPIIEHFDGAMAIFDNYRNTVSKNLQSLSLDDYRHTILPMVKLARFVDHGVCYGRLFGLSKYIPYIGRNPPRQDLSIDNNVFGLYDQNVLDTYNSSNSAFILAQSASQLVKDNEELTWATPTNDLPIRLFQTTNDLPTVLSAAEGAMSLQQVKEKIASCIRPVEKYRDGGADARKNMRIQNILEMNIVPVNVHAFMREVPFANLLNYSYTYDRMIHDFFVPELATSLLNQPVAGRAANAHSGSMISLYTPTITARSLMVKLLCYPYANLVKSVYTNPAIEYYAVLGNLFNSGVDMRSMDRPRFLSDQLWHKVLLNTANPMTYKYDNSEWNLGTQQESEFGIAFRRGFVNDGKNIGDNTNRDAMAATTFRNPKNTNGQHAFDAVSNLGHMTYGHVIKPGNDTKKYNNKLNELEDQTTGVWMTEIKNNDVKDDNKGIANLVNNGLIDMKEIGEEYRGLFQYNFPWTLGGLPKELINFNEIQYNQFINNVSDERLKYGLLWLIVHEARKAMYTNGSLLQILKADTKMSTANKEKEIDAIDAMDENNPATALIMPILKMVTFNAAKIPKLSVGLTTDEDSNAVLDSKYDQAKKYLLKTVDDIGDWWKPILKIMLTKDRLSDGKGTNVLMDGTNGDTIPPHQTIAELKAIDGKIQIPIPKYLKDEVKLNLIAPIHGPNTIPSPILSDWRQMSVNPLTTSSEYGKKLSEEFVKNVIKFKDPSLTLNIGGRSVIINYMPETATAMAPVTQTPTTDICEIKLYARPLMKALLMHYKLQTLRSKYPDHINAYEAAAANCIASLSNDQATTTNNAALLPWFVKDSKDAALKAAAQASSTVIANNVKYITFLKQFILTLPGSGNLQFVNEQGRQPNYRNVEQMIQMQNLSTPATGIGLRYFKKLDNEPHGRWYSANQNIDTPEKTTYLAELGRSRFDTKLIRNITWLVQNHRVMRAILGQHLSWISSPVDSALDATQQRFTEFQGNDMYNYARDFGGEAPPYNM